VTGNSVAFVAVGTCTVTANQAGNANYNAATEVSANIVVSNAPKTDQTISFSPALTGTVGTNATLSATATSGLTAITFASSPATVCTISGNTVSFVSAGNCIVTANQVGNDKFNAAKEVSATIVVSATAKKDQAVYPDAIYQYFPTGLIGTVGQTVTLSERTTFGLPVAFGSSPSTVCTVSGNVLSFVGAGNCIVTANQAGDANYNAAKEVSATIVVTANQTINFISPAAQVNPSYNPSLTLTATASSNLAVVFASSTPTICTVSGNVLSFVREDYLRYRYGTCTITANQAGNEKFNAAKEVSANIEANIGGAGSIKQDQTVTFLTDLTALVGQTVALNAKR